MKITRIIILSSFLALSISTASAQKQDTPAEKRTYRIEQIAKMDYAILLGTQNLYNTFLVIGAVWDNFNTKTYTAQTMKELMALQITFSNLAIDGMNKILDETVTNLENTEKMENIILLNRKLIQQAELAIQYTEDLLPETKKNYQETQIRNGAAITKFVGIE